MLPGRVNSGYYEDRYSATVAGAGAVLASTSSWVAEKAAEGGAHGRFADTPELRTVSASSTRAEPDVNQVTPAKRVLQPPPPKVYTSDDALRRKLSASVRQCCSNGAAGVGVAASLLSRLSTALGYGKADAPAAPGSTARPLRRSMSSRIAVEQQQGRVSEGMEDTEDDG